MGGISQSASFRVFYLAASEVSEVDNLLQATDFEGEVSHEANKIRQCQGQVFVGTGCTSAISLVGGACCAAGVGTS